MGSASSWVRVRVERGISLLPNGKYYVSARRGGRLLSRTVGSDLSVAWSAREALVASIEGFGTVAGWWLARFEAKVAAGERHPRTLDAHQYYLDRHLLPDLEPRCISALRVDDVAALLEELRKKGCSANTAAGALATLHSVIRYARRHGWIARNPVDQLEADERPRPTRQRQRVWAATGSHDCLRPAGRATDLWSRPRCIPGCGSRSCSA
jgi:hypothetical protein